MFQTENRNTMLEMKKDNGNLNWINSNAINKVVVFSIVIIIVPLATYFITKAIVFEGYFLMSSKQSYIYSAISAIFVVHILLGIFIFAAYNEEPQEQLKLD
ncbi:hypothetical protein SNEBB_011274 [Seison nebaliae]|nr:hypothetical protein SNEBB_011274 [Seison nebaliae]